MLGNTSLLKKTAVNSALEQKQTFFILSVDVQLNSKKMQQNYFDAIWKFRLRLRLSLKSFEHLLSPYETKCLYKMMSVQKKTLHGSAI